MVHRGHIGEAFLRAGVVVLFLGLAQGLVAHTIDVKNGSNSGGGNLSNNNNWSLGNSLTASEVAQWTNS